MKQMHDSSQNERYATRWGFTLIELLVVIAIISMLASILLPSLKTAQSLAIKSTCASRLHHIYTACGMYANDYNALQPTAMIWPAPAPRYRERWYWTLTALEYVPNDDDTQDTTYPDSGWNFETSFFTCPAGPMMDLGSHNIQARYGRNRRLGTEFRLGDIPDAQQKVFICDTASAASPWGGWGGYLVGWTWSPTWIWAQISLTSSSLDQRINGCHGDEVIANFLFADGHVDAISEAEKPHGFTSSVDWDGASY